ncbi:MAG: hypothetical protein ABI164_10365, partial [Acidobacteriaceae bacterium]
TTRRTAGFASGSKPSFVVVAVCLALVKVHGFPWWLRWATLLQFCLPDDAGAQRSIDSGGSSEAVF